MPKKAIVLFITLMFVFALSILTYKNLQDSESFLKMVQEKSALSQLMVSTQNIKSQIIQLIKQNSQYLDEVLPLGPIPLQISDNTHVMIDTIDTYDMVHYTKVKDQGINSYSYEQNVADKNITTHKQLFVTLSDYFRKFDDDAVYEIQDMLSPIDTSDTNSSFYQFSFVVQVGDKRSNAHYIIQVEQNNTVAIKDFEFVLK